MTLSKAWKLAAATLMLAGLGSAATIADVVAIVDESGSMSGEHAWVGGMIVSLNTQLIAAGVTPNQFGLVGYGGGGAGNAGRQIAVGGGQFGTAAQFATATGGLVTSGVTEDGYAGINFANGYSYRAGSARNYILITDEDRDNTNAALTSASILNGLVSAGTLLNAVVNASFRCGDNSVALGVSSGGVGYRADGAGGFTTCAGAFALSGAGTTINDYVNLALATGGAAWDLNQLRAGGLTADSFTAAFVDLKVAEIVDQGGVPEPSTWMLLASALLAGGLARRKRQ